MDKVNLNKIVYSRNQYQKVIDTNFTQLGPQSSTNTQTGSTVAEFFDLYNQLYLHHKYLFLKNHI